MVLFGVVVVEQRRRAGIIFWDVIGVVDGLGGEGQWVDVSAGSTSVQGRRESVDGRGSGRL